MFWSSAPMCLESERTVVEVCPQTCGSRAAKVAFAISIANERTTSAVRKRRRTYRRSSSECPWSPAATCRMPVFVP
jgi:hypothetical protein